MKYEVEKIWYVFMKTRWTSFEKLDTIKLSKIFIELAWENNCSISS